MKLVLKKLPSTIANFLRRFRTELIAVIILGIFGFIALQVRSILNPPIDQNHLQEQMDILKRGQLKFDEETLLELQRRSIEGESTDPSNRGDPNPFD